MKDYAKIQHVLVTFIKNYVLEAGVKNLVLGISGGLDSAVVATLCTQALPSHTYALIMPTNSSNPKNLNDAIALCEKLNIKFKIIDIQSILNSYEVVIGETLSNLRKGNLSARIRMSLLYDYSAANDALVVGTSNKSELMLGYGTIFGDLASAINPIGEIYKSDIFEFARYLGVDESIINKAPSADLWDGQSDEADIGYSYGVIDEILKFIDDDGNLVKKLDKNLDKKAVDKILNMVKSNKFKRTMPLIAKINNDIKDQK
ncbi:NAD+ synthase [Campylobacter sp. faydin G-140]|uniref:NAD+ synthase n=1 Tax=Campylobacter anatolicus TaxID=2829105 RepID=UPI001B8F1A15|nr:NAD+ synthase [Campylobacter anatolicus]MBR8462034.1 NAD+ synthase [Campylobacter anatolicus]MBR8464879.1 NAD+ synthase [Campylobacter anatolicus]